MTNVKTRSTHCSQRWMVSERTPVLSYLLQLTAWICLTKHCYVPDDLTDRFMWICLICLSAKTYSLYTCALSKWTSHWISTYWHAKRQDFPVPTLQTCVTKQHL